MGGSIDECEMKVYMAIVMPLFVGISSVLSTGNYVTVLKT
jgi:hypothetical protein